MTSAKKTIQKRRTAIKAEEPPCNGIIIASKRPASLAGYYGARPKARAKAASSSRKKSK